MHGNEVIVHPSMWEYGGQCSYLIISDSAFDFHHKATVVIYSGEFYLCHLFANNITLGGFMFVIMW